MSTRVLRLYIAGKSVVSRRATTNVVRLRELIEATWEVEIIDVLAHPEIAERDGILATPTLSYQHAERLRRVIGDLSEPRHVLAFLGIDVKET